MSRTSSLEIISHKGELPSLDHTRLRKIRKKYLYKFNELWVWYLFATIFYKKNSTQAVRRGRQYLHSPKKLSPVEFWYELDIATQKKKKKKIFYKKKKKKNKPACERIENNNIK